jgi:hypothetical protein
MEDQAPAAELSCADRTLDLPWQALIPGRRLTRNELRQQAFPGSAGRARRPVPDPGGRIVSRQTVWQILHDAGIDPAHRRTAGPSSSF